MIRHRPILSVLFVAFLLIRPMSLAPACGPSFIEPIFVFKGSPDPPFNEFTRGKIGILLPSFGRKTLVIAYRQLNGGSFSAEEQEALVAALHGSAPEEDSMPAIRAWVTERRRFLNDVEKLPQIYVERQYGGYDFFPNCAKNAFEVALETLKDRVGSYGEEDKNVRAWISAQDMVFQNCAGGKSVPAKLGAESPEWLRRDRDYQIGAAYLYSLSFEEARAQFEQIAADLESPWQQTADYLVARTLVRQASLTNDAERKNVLYEQAEARLELLLNKGGKFQNASRKLSGLVRYRQHPEERVRELAATLTAPNDENLRQDLIDYVWLLDKFEVQVLKEKEERREAAKARSGEKQKDDWAEREEKRKEEWEKGPYGVRHRAIEKGELIEVRIYLKNADGTTNYTDRGVGFDFRSDISRAEILQAFEAQLGRKLSEIETTEIDKSYESAMSHRAWSLSPNRLWPYQDHESYQTNEKLEDLKLLPEFLRADDLSDWIMSVPVKGPGAYSHARKKWRETGSRAWLILALMKADGSSPGVVRLMEAAENVSKDDPAFASAAYHLVRLNIAVGKKTEARRLVDDVLKSSTHLLPVSAINEFREQRMQLAEDLHRFLRSALRKPVTFYEEGQFGSLSDFLATWKENWNSEYSDGTSKEDFQREVEERFRNLLPWNDRFALDEKTAEIFNTHLPLRLLADAGFDGGLPDYLRLRFLFSAWTRAILLKNDEVAQRVAPEIIKLSPDVRSLMQAYLDAGSARGRHNAAIYLLLKFPSLSPFVPAGLPYFKRAEELDYYFETSWWCTPTDMEYDDDSNEVPKRTPKPEFLTAEQLELARRERAALTAIGEGKSYLGKQAIEWAKAYPSDARVPEALFLASRANAQYKYGCNSWEYDVWTKEAAEDLLRKNYRRSPWAAKLTDLGR